ncbi:MAG TPA: ATPase, partial [Erythrobacter sp.]|nr:ATPase [Erythrobacter sp.]
MRKRSLIQAVDQTPDETHEETVVSEEFVAETSPELEEDDEVVWDDESAARRRFSWLLPAAAILAIAGWTAFFAWAHASQLMALPTPRAWTALVTQWAVPVLLVIGVWLLAMRNSAREARRFATVAHDLSAQSAELESRLATINRELSLAREFLTSQTRDLDYLGRTATDRLSEHADRLQALVADNGEQVEAIARVSVTALENMDKLRDNLPVVASSAKDVSNQIGSAGREAQNQLDGLVDGFARLNEFGSASERQVASLRERIDGALEAFSQQADHLAEIADRRFSELREGSEDFRGELDRREVEALASLRTRFDKLRSEFAETETATAADRETAVASLTERLAAIREETAHAAATIREGEAQAMNAWQEQIEAMRERMNDAVEEIARVDDAALEAANAKLAALAAEAERVDTRIAERNRMFAQETTERQVAMAEAEEAAQQRLTQRLAALDEAIADRRA